MPPVIRPATAADLDVICDFNARLALESEGKELDGARLRRGVAALIADARLGRYFLYEDVGVVLGQLALTYEWSDWRDGMFWWLQSVYVEQAHRGRGIFRALFEHVEELARRDATVVGLRLYVENGNGVARDVYARLGLAPAGYLVLEKSLLA